MNASSLAPAAAALFLASTLFSHTVALRLVALAFGSACCLVAIAKEGRSLRLLPPVWLPFALWALWAAASLAWSVDPALSAKEFRNEVIYAGLALWFCFVAAQARLAPRLILAVVAAGATVLCALALYHFPQGFERYAAGWHGGPGNLSSALIVLLPCVVLVAWSVRRAPVPLWCAGLIVLLAAAAYTTLNRTIWVAFGAQLLIIGLHVSLRQGVNRTGVAFALILVAVAAVAAVHIHGQRVAAGGLELQRDQRLSLWPQVLEHVAERPLTGHGFGRGVLQKPLKEEFKDPLLWHAHNLFLDAALQVGVVGVALLLFLFTATLFEGVRLAREPDPVASACGLALTVIVIGVLIRNFTDTLLVRQNALFYWGVVGVLLAWGRTRRVAH